MATKNGIYVMVDNWEINETQEEGTVVFNYISLYRLPDGPVQWLYDEAEDAPHPLHRWLGLRTLDTNMWEKKQMTRIDLVARPEEEEW